MTAPVYGRPKPVPIRTSVSLDYHGDQSHLLLQRQVINAAEHVINGKEVVIKFADDRTTNKNSGLVASVHNWGTQIDSEKTFKI